MFFCEDLHPIAHPTYTPTHTIRGVASRCGTTNQIIELNQYDLPKELKMPKMVTVSCKCNDLVTVDPGGSQLPAGDLLVVWKQYEIHRRPSSVELDCDG